MAPSLIRRILAPGLTVLLSGVAGVALGELALRIAGVRFPVFDMSDPQRGTALRPGKTGWYRLEGNAYVSINSLGYRDAEHPRQKPPGTVRIAVLGDSFAEARQVDVADTFWSHLGGHLNQCAALAGRRVEVLNFGVGGYATTQELLTLRRDVLQFSPDMVLLAFFAGNDVHDNSKALSQGASWRLPRPYPVLVAGRLEIEPPVAPGIWQAILYEGVHHFRVLELVNEVRRRFTVARIRRGAKEPDGFDLGTAAGIYTPPADAVWASAWALTEALLAQMNRETRAGGASFVAFAVTMAEQVHPDAATRAVIAGRPGVTDMLFPDRWLSATGRTHGFPVITLAESMRATAIATGTYFHGFSNTVMGQGHWNETGHRQAGELLARGLCSSPVLP